MTVEWQNILIWTSVIIALVLTGVRAKQITESVEKSEGQGCYIIAWFGIYWFLAMMCVGVLMAICALINPETRPW